MNTDELIANLTDDTARARALPAPTWLWAVAMVLFLVYGSIVLGILGPRADMASFIRQPLVMVELALMVGMLSSSLWSAVCLIYPDQYQQPMLTRLPFLLLGVLALVLGAQSANTDINHMLAHMPQHLECVSCLAVATMIPAIGLFVLTQKGASTSHAQSGSIAFFAAAAIAGLALRLAEVTQDMMHLLLAHYAPIALFAGLGVLLGQRLLRW